MKNNGYTILQSIPVKICLSILIIETFLLSLMGFIYTRNFNNEIDENLTEKMHLPAILMSLRALSFHAVNNLNAIADLIQEEVLDAFITKGDGTIYYTADLNKEGKNYRSFLSQQEMMFPDSAVERAEYAQFREPDGNFYRSILAPLLVDDRFLGNLYIKISVNHAEQKKHDVLMLFLWGGSLTILLTTILEAFFLYRMFVPRIQSASKVLKKVEAGDFTAHVIETGAPDQLGKLIEQVNGMIKTVSLHTETLITINAAGEQLGLANSYRQLTEIASALLAEYFDVQLDKQYPVVAKTKMNDGGLYQPLGKPITYTKDQRQLYLTLPVDTVHKEMLQTGFLRSDGRSIHLIKEKPAFLRSLNRMLNSSIRRVDAVESISVAEAKYRKLYSSTVDGIFRSTPEGQVEEANPALAEMLGYASSKELIRERTDLARQAYSLPQARDSFLHYMNTAGHIIDWEVNCKRKDGTVFPASISAQVVKTAEDKIIAFEGRIINITDRKLREKADREREIAQAASKAQADIVKELEINRQQLQNSLAEKEILLREVLHRTKNNMLVIISLLQLQLQSVDDQKIHSIFTDTENRIRAMALVHEKLYKSENFTEIDLGDYLSDMGRTLIKTMVMDHRIEITINTQPVNISIDYAVPLGLAVNEIFTNAIKHGFPEGRPGNISLDLWQNDDKLIKIIIKDDGAGLPSDFNAEKFSSFGMQMTHNLITKQLLGSYSLDSDNGTEITIEFTEPQRLRRV